jgi:hypothetical protein
MKLRLMVLQIALIGAIAGGYYLFYNSPVQKVKRLSLRLQKTNDSQTLDELRAASLEMGPAAVPILMSAARRPGFERAADLIHLCGEFGPRASAAVPELLEILKADLETYKKNADRYTLRNPLPGSKLITVVETLSRIKDNRVAPHLLELFDFQTNDKNFPRNDYALALAKLTVEILGTLNIATPDTLQTMADLVWSQGWRGVVCEKVRAFDSAKAASIADECEAFESLNKTEVNLVAPLNEAKVSSDDMAFRWRIEPQSPKLSYCSAVFTDKGTNPLDNAYEDKFFAGKASQLKVNLWYRNFEWAVVTVVCRGQVECNPKIIPRSFLERFLSLRNDCFSFASDVRVVH